MAVKSRLPELNRERQAGVAVVTSSFERWMEGTDSFGEFLRYAATLQMIDESIAAEKAMIATGAIEK